MFLYVLPKRVRVTLETEPGFRFRTVPVEVDGFEVNVAATIIVSPIEPAAWAIAKRTVVPTPTRVGPKACAVTEVAAEVAADAGATEVRTPKPKAATVTSATRLKVVFVDICFLSISRDREFPVLGFELIS